MALTESQIKVIIAAELQKGGFDKADRAAKNLTKTFQKLGATIGVALSARAFINFAKQGAVAFAAEEKAVKQLTNSLANLGFAFSVPAVERYIENVEKATMVSKDELRPAMVQLISTTMSAKKSMDLLGTALDIAAETGADVGQVTTALSRAYNGNYSAIAKLSKGYTAAQLKAAGFNTTIDLLNERFSGSASAATDSYSFKIAQLQKAVGDAQKEIGKGLIAGLEQLGSGDYNEGLQDLVDFGTSIGKSFGYAAGAVNTLKEAYDLITLRPVRDLTSQLLGKTQQQQLGGTITPTQFELAKAAVERRKEKAIRDAEKRDREKLRKLEEAERKKREAALKKEQQLKRAGTIFDMENIQIVAAMQAKITENERLRLSALLAINTGNADAAEKLSTAVLAANAAALANLGIMMKSGDSISDVVKKIIEAQGKAAILGMNIGAIPKAPNPFEAWPSIIAGLLSQIGTLNSAINNLGKGTPSVGGTTGGTSGGTTSGTKGNTGVGGETVTVPSAITPPAGVSPGTSLGGGFTMGANQYPNSSYFAGIAATAPYISSSYFATAPDIRTTAPTVVVNIAGNVTAEQDLIDAITEGLYTVQKRGQNVVYNAVAI